jgi:hypothetical protein
MLVKMESGLSSPTAIQPSEVNVYCTIQASQQIDRV